MFTEIADYLAVEFLAGKDAGSQFHGLYVDPDAFRVYESVFDKISIEIQRFPSKPVSYRKFRFNIAMRGKRELGPA